jgi:predicted MPP superfamily phosphohydrolase
MNRTFTRRQLLKAGGIAAAGAGVGTTAVGFYTWQFEPHWLEFTRPQLPISALAANLEGRTLAHISDLHVGPQVADAYLLETFGRVQAMGPDFVVCTGDWITYRGPAQIAQLRRVLARAPRGRLGTVGILGNHDYGLNWRQLEVADEVASIAHEAGFTMLRNESCTIAGLQILGIDDLWGPYFSPERLLSEKGKDASTIVLCHNPDAVDHEAWKDYKGWTLVGHTHGGQCKPPFLPPPELPVLNRRYVAGEIALESGGRMYISRGVGHLLQVRFNVRPEVALFELRRAG